MRKRIITMLLAVCLLLPAVASAARQIHEPGQEINWAEEQRAQLRVGNTTPLRGRFFTTLWGGTTSDMDVQTLLNAYAPVCYDLDLGQFRFDLSVVQDAAILDDAEGNRTYMLVLHDDLLWSDGTQITVADYAFSILFSMDPVIAETGGKQGDYSWLVGAEEYLSEPGTPLRGVRIVTDQILQIEVKAEALPYFYELSRLMINPYPIAVVAPGISVKDDGEGVYLSDKLTAETITRTVLDPETGYLSHPSIVSGPYTLTAFDGVTARFQINPYYKGNEKGVLPRIGEMEYTLAENEDMIQKLGSGEFGLLNKVTMKDSIDRGVQGQTSMGQHFISDNYARTGLTMLWFTESSPLAQETAVRKAIAWCFDRQQFVEDYTGQYGFMMDAFTGLSQWMYLLATGQIQAPVDERMPEAEQETVREAYEKITLDGVTKYELDTAKAAAILEEAGWLLNEDGIRRRTVNGETQELRITIGLPESTDAASALDSDLVQYLKEAGIAAELKLLPMVEVEKVYRAENASVDVLYIGENFSVRFDPELLAPQKTETSETDNLTAEKAELYEMLRDMVRTEPNDILGFMQKWVAAQERITETLPLLPVYSNSYFDFFTRELHNYKITQAITWGQAIVESYISDAESEVR